jgi:hypothetical protein
LQACHSTKQGISGIDLVSRFGKITAFRQCSSDPFDFLVSKKDGEKRTYFIQREDGLRLLKEKEYGRTRPAENDITQNEKI